MSIRKVDGIWAVTLDETDQDLGVIDYAAGEVLKLDVTTPDTTGLGLSLAMTTSADPVDAYEPDAIVEGTGQFRIPDEDEMDEWIEEGGIAFFNIWTGPDADPIRRAYGQVRRKVSIRRRAAAPGWANDDLLDLDLDVSELPHSELLLPLLDDAGSGTPVFTLVGSPVDVSILTGPPRLVIGGTPRETSFTVRVTDELARTDDLFVQLTVEDATAIVVFEPDVFQSGVFF